MSGPGFILSLGTEQKWEMGFSHGATHDLYARTNGLIRLKSSFLPVNLVSHPF